MKRRTQLLLALTLFLLSACDERILHDLDELRANQVVVALAESGIHASKERSGTRWDITVAGSDVIAALRSLEASRILQRDLERTAGDGESILRTKEERSRAIEREIALSLERTLEQLPGILEARVHLSRKFSPESAFHGEKTDDSASVLLLAAPGSTLSNEQVQKLVAGGAGIDPRNVTLVVTVNALERKPFPQQPMPYLQKLPIRWAVASDVRLLGFFVVTGVIALLILRQRRKPRLPRPKVDLPKKPEQVRTNGHHPRSVPLSVVRNSEVF